MLDVFLERTLESLSVEPFPENVALNIEQSLHTALLKINPDCSDDYLAGARDMACSYIEARLQESDYDCEWVDGDDHTGHFVLSLKEQLKPSNKANAN